jgi:PKD repeat protein
MAGYGDLPYGDSPYKDEGVLAFSATPRSGLVPLSVQFTDLTIDSTSWEWDFGDGSSHSFIQNPNHFYPDDGAFGVTMTADGTAYSRANFISVNVATPVITPSGGTYTDLLTISMSCATGDATIYYTLDGSTPTTGSPIYSAPLIISSSLTIKAKAFRTSPIGSAVDTETYVLPNIKYANIDDSYSGSGHAGTSSAAYVNVANSNANRGSTVDASHSGDGMFNYNWNFIPDIPPNSINYFKLIPVRNGRTVISKIVPDVLLTRAASAGGGTYFDDISKVARVDILFTDSNSREIKRIIHIGATLEGFVSWTLLSTPGLWQAYQARLIDNDGAELFIDRSILGNYQDITFS